MASDLIRAFKEDQREGGDEAESITEVTDDEQNVDEKERGNGKEWEKK